MSPLPLVSRVEAPQTISEGIYCAINAFSPVLDNFEMNNKEIIIMGVFNIDLINDKHIIIEYISIC